MRRSLGDDRAAREDGVEQLLLVVEIIVQQRVVDADALGDVLQRHAVEAVPARRDIRPRRGSAPSSRRAARPWSDAGGFLTFGANARPLRLALWQCTRAALADSTAAIFGRSRILSILPVGARGMRGTRNDLVGNPPGRDPAPQRLEQGLVADRLGVRGSRPAGPAARPISDPAGRSPRPATTSGSAPTTASISAGIDPFAARLDQVLGAAGDDEVAVGIDPGEIAGREPAVGVGRRLLVAEIALDDRGAAHAQMSLDAALLAAARRPSASVSSRSTPTAGRPDKCGRARRVIVGRRHRARRRQLGHAPAGLHRDAQPVARSAPSAPAATGCRRR